MCVVEVEGKDKLITACSHPVEEWMIIKTHSPRVIKARKTIIELLLSNHPDDCLYCERNLNCELQKLAEEHNVRERRFNGRKYKHKKDLSNPAVQYDPSKCILCGRCIRTCDEIQATSTFDFSGRGLMASVSTCFGKLLNTTNCISCGQCIMACPTAALHEKRHYPGIQDALSNPEKTVVVMYEPLITASLPEALNIKTSKELNGTLNAMLRKIGFNYVFETAFSTDIMLIELAHEFTRRKESGENLPMISSNCPSWVKYAEQFYHNLLPHLSECKSPQQMLGSIIKNVWAKENGIATENLYTVSLSPCVARKFEGQRDELSSRGISEIDAVMTTRELAQFIRLFGIDATGVESEPPDQPFSGHTSASHITGAAGGLTEGLIRCLQYMKNTKEIGNIKISELRNSKARKELKLMIGKQEMKFVAVSGMANARKLLEEVIAQPLKYDWIEIMACPMGCVNGGGQPFNAGEATLKARSKCLYDADDKDSLKLSNKHPQVQHAYTTILGEAGSKKCHELLYTHFNEREVLQ
jgi:NADH-quinone oxidoreductase subunit G/NADP-reducing hydrogenase subunit HndD